MSSSVSVDSKTPGNIEIQELSAQKFDGGTPVDIRSIVASIDITASIVNPTIFARILLIDNLDILNNEVFSFTGEEFINISLRRNNTEFRFTYKFVVSSMSVEIKSASADSSVSALTLLSVDSFVNSSLFKSKGYTGTITEIIRSILETELKTKISINRFADSVDGQTFAFTEIKPFEKISMLTPRASLNSPSITSMFMFYENRSGYNFEPFEDIMERASANSEPISFINTPLESVNRDDQLNAILSYMPRSTFNNHRRMYHGLYNSNVKAFDFITKTVDKQELSILEKIDELKHLNASDPGSSTNFSTKVKELGSLTYFIPTDSSIIDRTSRALLNNSPFSILLQENTLIIKTFGNFSYDVGDPVLITILDNNPLQNQNKKPDPRYSGKYLIHTITHEIGIDQHGYTMLNNIVLIREGTLRDVKYYDKQYTTGDIALDAIAKK